MEKYIQGYCRTFDHARTVMAEKDTDWEFDCDYPACAHIASCPIAKELRELEESY